MLGGTFHQTIETQSRRMGNPILHFAVSQEK